MGLDVEQSPCEQARQEVIVERPLQAIEIQ